MQLNLSAQLIKYQFKRNSLDKFSSIGCTPLLLAAILAVRFFVARRKNGIFFRSGLDRHFGEIDIINFFQEIPIMDFTASKRGKPFLSFAYVAILFTNKRTEQFDQMLQRTCAVFVCLESTKKFYLIKGIAAQNKTFIQKKNCFKFNETVKQRNQVTHNKYIYRNYKRAK